MIQIVAGDVSQPVEYLPGMQDACTNVEWRFMPRAPAER